jgi:hypothetical protein
MQVIDPSRSSVAHFPFSQFGFSRACYIFYLISKLACILTRKTVLEVRTVESRQRTDDSSDDDCDCNCDCCPLPVCIEVPPTLKSGPNAA